jgi:hypothetical protein
MAKKKSKKLDPQEQPRVPYKMPRPNDDQHAYGWDLKCVRRPVIDGAAIEQGLPIFHITQPYDVRLEYGMDIQFLDPAFVNLRLSQSEAVQAALAVVKEQNYAPESLVKVEHAIQKVFEDLMLKEIRSRFSQVTPMLAQFFAARQAYVNKYGKD